MSKIRVLLCATLALTMAACTTTRDFAVHGYESPSGDYRLVVMEPDISVGLLTMGGVVEPNEEWTNQATENVTKALVKHQQSRGGNTTVAMTLEEAGGDTEALRDLVSLHNAVGGAIFVHKYSVGLDLPTKQNKFDWTLGESAIAFGGEAGYDYALFIHAQNSHSSGARKGLQVAGLLSCAVGVCVGVSGGQQIAFASLVDLKTGRISWFNVLTSTVGDLRTTEGAEQMITTLLESMNPDTTG